MKSARVVTLLFAAALVLPAQAGVYKWVDANGEVHYGDLPPPGGDAKLMDLPDYSRYAPRPLPAAGDTGSRESKAQPVPAAAGAANPESYDVLRITQPAANATVRGAEGNVNVQLAIAPALGEGHYVTFTLDGRSLGKRVRGTSFDLSGIERGTHSLRALIVDGEGRQVAASDPVSFTMRQESLFLPGRAKPENPIVPPSPDRPTSVTPGQTNPAYAPAYGN
jgi:hypothetical protein